MDYAFLIPLEQLVYVAITLVWAACYGIYVLVRKLVKK